MKKIKIIKLILLKKFIKKKNSKEYLNILKKKKKLKNS